MKKYILASQSPRRRELLGKLGIAFSVEPAEGKEQASGETVGEYVQKLAAAKAMEIAGRHAGEDVVIIGADTVVESLEGEILGKPKDRAHLRQMMQKLAGKTHQVYTGVAVYDGTTLHTFSECTYVTFYPMTDDELDHYAQNSDGLDKAGGYGIQSDAAVYVRDIRGDYNNVVGLPLARLYHEMKKMGCI